MQEIRRKTRRRSSAEEKIRIVLEGLRGEESIATLRRKEGLAPNLYYPWTKEFREAGKKRLVGDTSREATAPEVTDLRKENARLKQPVAEIVLENRPQKKRDGLRLRRRHVRLTAADKHEVIRLVEGSDLSVRQTLRGLQVPRRTFYRWYRRYRAAGIEGLTPRRAVSTDILHFFARVVVLSCPDRLTRTLLTNVAELRLGSRVTRRTRCLSATTS